MNIRFNSKALLVAGLVSIVPAKLCKKQPIKFTNCIVDTVSFASRPVKNILVADEFKINDIDINGDILGDVTHGFVTSSIIEKGLPDAKVVKCDIFPKSGIDRHYVAEHLDKLFTSVLKKMDEGKKFDAINLSIGFPVSYEALSREVNRNLDTANIAYYAKEVKEILHNKNGNFLINLLPMKEIMSVVDKMDTISAKGTKIYIAAGNSSDATFNLLALSDSTNIVGALDRRGRNAIYSDRNTLVNRFENGEIVSKSVKGGFDFTDDGKPDVAKKETTAFFNFTTPFSTCEGTSFATPRAIVKDFSK